MTDTKTETVLESTTTIRLGEKKWQIPTQKLQEFKQYLVTHQDVRHQETDLHIRFLLNGNYIAVTEFLQWYEYHKQ